MKKSNPIKLTVRRETIRALATLELARAVGGDMAMADQTETCKVMCTLPAAVIAPAGG